MQGEKGPFIILAMIKILTTICTESVSFGTDAGRQHTLVLLECGGDREEVTAGATTELLCHKLCQPSLSSQSEAGTVSARVSGQKLTPSLSEQKAASLSDLVL